MNPLYGRDVELAFIRAEIVLDPESDGPRLRFAARCQQLGLTGHADRIRHALRNPKATHRSRVPGTPFGSHLPGLSSRGATRNFSIPPEAVMVWRRGFVDELRGRWEVLASALPWVLAYHPWAAVRLWTYPIHGYRDWGENTPAVKAQDPPVWVLAPYPGNNLVPRDGERARKYGISDPITQGGIAKHLVPFELFEYFPPTGLRDPILNDSIYARRLLDSLYYWVEDGIGLWPTAWWVHTSPREADAAFQTAVRGWARARWIADQREGPIDDGYDPSQPLD